MFIIKGYNVLDKELNSILRIIRFSSFSNLFCDSRADMDAYRAMLEATISKEINETISIIFLMFEITSRSKEGIILKEYLEKKPYDQIAKIAGVSEEYAMALIETYLHRVKL